MNDLVKYGLYFLIGGLVVSVSTYLGTKGPRLPRRICKHLSRHDRRDDSADLSERWKCVGHGLCQALAVVRPTVAGLCRVHHLWAGAIGILDDDGGRADALHGQRGAGEAGYLFPSPCFYPA